MESDRTGVANITAIHLKKKLYEKVTQEIRTFFFFGTDNKCTE